MAEGSVLAIVLTIIVAVEIIVYALFALTLPKSPVQYKEALGAFPLPPPPDARLEKIVKNYESIKFVFQKFRKAHNYFWTSWALGVLCVIKAPMFLSLLFLVITTILYFWFRNFKKIVIRALIGTC